MAPDEFTAAEKAVGPALAAAEKAAGPEDRHTATRQLASAQPAESRRYAPPSLRSCPSGDSARL